MVNNVWHLRMVGEERARDLQRDAQWDRLVQACRRCDRGQPGEARPLPRPWRREMSPRRRKSLARR